MILKTKSKTITPAVDEVFMRRLSFRKMEMKRKELILFQSNKHRIVLFHLSRISLSLVFAFPHRSMNSSVEYL